MGTAELLAYVPPMPAKRPKGVTAKQWRLAAIYPRAESAYQALVAAGYTPVTALASSAVILGSSGIARAKQAQEEAQRDTAHEIARKAGRIVADRLDTMQDQGLIAAWKVAHDIKAASPPEVTTARLPSSWYRAQVRRALLRAYRLGQRASGMRAAGPAAPGSPSDESSLND
jgi:hypothetical protein